MSADQPREPRDGSGPSDANAPSSTTTYTTTDTTSGETSTMSHDDSTSAAPQFSDPLADPTTNPPPAAADPDATTTIPASSTQALPTPSPFRVEPSAPVPDDVVTDATQLPHLPPPSQPDPSQSDPSQSGAWPPPAGTAPSHPDPGPALVTVRKGPRPGSIMFGLLTMIVAGWLLAANLTDSDLTFRLVGPPMIGAFGGMLLIVGLAGVVAGRLRR